MSTLDPGPTKPATATTSSTRIDTARIPSGITAAIPAPASAEAKRLPRMISSLKVGYRTARPIASWTLKKEPLGGSPTTHSASLKSSSASFSPTFRSFDAMTTRRTATLAFTGSRFSCLNTRKLANPATTSASISVITILERFIRTNPFPYFSTLGVWGAGGRIPLRSPPGAR